MDSTPPLPQRPCPKCGGLIPAGRSTGICPSCAYASALTASSDGEGTRPISLHDIPKPGEKVAYVGDYEILETIAQGGMGVVYKARQKKPNRLVALKMLLGGKHASPSHQRRFLEEPELAAKLQHPNIVPIYEVGEHGGLPYFSMEFVAGSDLATLTREQPLPPRRAAGYLRTVAEAVHYAHQRKLLHRDLKPANILIGPDDRPRITDFGLARQVDVESGQTLSGDMLGTPGYLPPEQVSVKHGAVTQSSDVYSLGAVLYHLLTGRPPFLAGSLAETLQLVLKSEPVALRTLNPALPRDLETICLKCLEKEPSRRYGSAKELAEELVRFLAGQPIKARPVSYSERVAKWYRREPVVAGLVSTVITIFLVGFALTFWQWREAKLNAAGERRQRTRSEKLLARMSVEQAQSLMAVGYPARALAHLADTVRRTPDDRVAVATLVSALDALGPVSQPHIRFEQDCPLRSAQFSPTGGRSLTISTDGKARVWDTGTGKAVRELAHESAYVLCGVMLDDQRVVTATTNGMLHYWDAAEGRLLKEVQAHKEPIHCLRASPDGRWLATAAGNTASLWEVATGNAVGNALIHKGAVASLEFSPDSKRLVTASWDGVASIIETGSAQGRRQDLQHENCLQVAKFSPDGRLVATGMADGSVCLWNSQTGELVRQWHPHREAVIALDFSPVTNFLLTASSDATAQLWRIPSGEPLGPSFKHEESITAASFSPDGNKVATASSDGTVWVWHIAKSAAPAAPLYHGGPVLSACFDPAGSRLLTASEDATAVIWPIPSPRPPANHLGPPTALCCAFAADGRRLAVGRSDGTVEVVDPAKPDSGGECLKGDESAVVSVTFSADGRLLLAAHQDFRGRLWRLGSTNSSPLVLARHKDDILATAFSPDGNCLVTASRDGRACVRDTGTGKLRFEVRHTEAIYCAAFSPDNRLLATASADRCARVVEVRTGLPLFDCPLEAPVLQVAFSPDARRFVTASEDGTVRVWNAITGRNPITLLGHEDAVYFAGFSPNSALLITAAKDRTARLWDVVRGGLAVPVLRHDGPVSSAAFSTDGHWVITAAEDGAVRVWSTEDGRMAGRPLLHPAPVVWADFSPSGLGIATICSDKSKSQALLWDRSPSVFPAPVWLGPLAESVGGLGVDAQGAYSRIASSNRTALLRTLRRLEGTNALASWAVVLAGSVQ